MSRVPRIAVTGMWSNRIHGMRFDGNAVAAAVLRSVIRAGGEPVTLFAESALTPRERLQGFDALLVPGGADINPDRYGQARHEKTVTADFVAQDQFESEMLAAAFALDLPVLAICRGFQLANVEHGGSLVQDLPEDSAHRNSVHGIEIEPGSRLAEITGATHIDVSSYHHQAVDRVGSDLRVVARSEDGIVEALEHLDPARRLVAIQWHPEDSAAEDPLQHALFQWLVDSATELQERRA